MIKQLYIGLALVIFTLTACKKEVSLKGKVYHALTSEGIPDVKVVLRSGLKSGNVNGEELSTLTDSEGKFSFTEKLSKRGAHQLAVLGLNSKDYYFMSGPNYNMLNGNFDGICDVAVLPLKTIVFFAEDTTKTISSEAFTEITMRHTLAKDYYPTKPFPIREKNDLVFSDQLTSSIKMPHGWNYLSGKSLRQDGSVYQFVDSFFVDYSNSHQIWNLKY
jgi:hypothetical protein